MKPEGIYQTAQVGADDAPQSVPNFAHNYNSLDILSPLNDAKLRMLDEITRQRRISATNLLISLFFAIGAVVLALHISQPIDKLSYAQIFRAIVLPSTFYMNSRFFIAAYRSSLNDIKYFHNEITKVDSSAVAVIGAQRSGNVLDMTRVVAELLKTERNRLKKGERSLNESENVGFAQLLTALSKPRER